MLWRWWKKTDKHQITSTKFQTNCFVYLDIWVWSLFGIWSLGFGISNDNSFLVPAILAIETAEGSE
jgi:hypothetical protein